MFMTDLLGSTPPPRRPPRGNAATKHVASGPKSVINPIAPNRRGNGANPDLRLGAPTNTRM
eukprot:4467694-Lingulodinium_polyedra.AAC.1